jgi:hypothetical protein
MGRRRLMGEILKRWMRYDSRDSDEIDEIDGI